MAKSMDLSFGGALLINESIVCRKYEDEGDDDDWLKHRMIEYVGWKCNAHTVQVYEVRFLGHRLWHNAHKYLRSGGVSICV